MQGGCHKMGVSQSFYAKPAAATYIIALEQVPVPSQEHLYLEATNMRYEHYGVYGLLIIRGMMMN